MATIIGLRTSSFTGDDGAQVSGMNIYYTEQLEKGEGLSSGRVFLTFEKLAKCAYDPKVGDEIRIEYNRFGRCSGIYPED